MYRPGTNGVFPLTFILLIFLIASCGNAQVLGVPRGEAMNLLGKGDIDFIRAAELPGDFESAGFPQAVSRYKQLTQIHPAAPFYAGLLAGAELKTLLFCATLESSSLPARQEAIHKLVPIVLETEDIARNILAFLNSAKHKEKNELLRAACLYRLGLYGDAAKALSNDREGEWQKALVLFAEWKDSAVKTEALRRKILGFLFEGASGATPGITREKILSWAYGEALSLDGLLSSSEAAIVSAKLTPENYNALLARLPEALTDSGIIFFYYTELIADLGRAFQYTPAMREEGLRIFRSWDRLLEGTDGANANSDLGDFLKTHNKEKLKAGKFMILFYSGRIERARGNYDESSEYFNRALAFAPDALQSDSCIWYLLMNSLIKDPMYAVSLALDTMRQWNDPAYFDDFLDRLSCYFTRTRQWGLMLQLFKALERHDEAGASLAQYAWILGRAAQEGFIKGSAGDFFRVAFERGKGGYYYRAMAALKLGTSFIPDNPRESPAANRKENRPEEKGEMEFILGFFECGASAFALPYIRAREENLSVPELQKAAEALAGSSRWKESLDLVSRYINRKDYELGRKDLLLFYPQPYRELIEKYAKEAGLAPEILYGLIRTESYFMSGIVSRSGAAGLAQLMAPTAAEMAGRIARRGGPDYRGPNGVDLKDPEINIHLGSCYLAYLTEQMGSHMPALLAYNGGMGRIRNALAAYKRRDGGLPPDFFPETIEIHETREYGRRVLTAAAVYGYLYYGKSMEDAVADVYR